MNAGHHWYLTNWQRQVQRGPAAKHPLGATEVQIVAKTALGCEVVERSSSPIAETADQEHRTIVSRFLPFIMLRSLTALDEQAYRAMKLASTQSRLAGYMPSMYAVYNGDFKPEGEGE